MGKELSETKIHLNTNIYLYMCINKKFIIYLYSAELVPRCVNLCRLPIA